MAIRRSNFYNNPEIGQAFTNLAQAFAPPSGSDLAGYAQAALTRQKAKALSDYLTLGATATPEQRDLAAYAADLYDPRNGIGARDMESADRRYTSDQSLAGTKYTADRTFESSRANNAADNEQKMKQAILSNEKDLGVAMLTPVVAGATRFVPPAFQAKYGVPDKQVGTLSASAGETVLAPNGQTLSGAPTNEQVLAAAFRDVRDKGLITDQNIVDAIMGKEAPVQAIDPLSGAPRFMAPGEAARIGAKPATDVTKQGDAAHKLRGEITQLPSYKNHAQAMPVYRSMLSTADRDTKASDLNLIYGLAKILDPGSVVRESEIVMAQDTQGTADRLNGMVNAVIGGSRLMPDARAALMREAHSRMLAYEDVLDRDLAHYGGIGDRVGLNRADVLPPFERSKPFEPKQASQPVPAAGRASAPTSNAAPVRVSTPAEAMKLPPGTPVILPDGSRGFVPALEPTASMGDPMGAW